MAITRNINDDNTLAYLFKKDINAAHPVGSVFVSTSSTDPAKTLGGKWRQRADMTLPSDMYAWERIS